MSTQIIWLSWLSVRRVPLLAVQRWCVALSSFFPDRLAPGRTAVELPPHWHSPQNRLAGAGTSKESIPPPDRKRRADAPVRRRHGARRRTCRRVLDLKGVRFRNHLRAFRFSSSKTVTKVEFLETRAPQSSSGTSIRHQNRPPGKEARPRMRHGEAKLGGNVSLRERRCAKRCSPGVVRDPFCVGPCCHAQQIASRPR
jgi:hypothetical protein